MYDAIAISTIDTHLTAREVGEKDTHCDRDKKQWLIVLRDS